MAATTTHPLMRPEQLLAVMAELGLFKKVLKG